MARTCRNPQPPVLFLALLLIASLYVLSLDFSVIFEEYEASSAPKRSRAILQTPMGKQSTMKMLHQDQTTTIAAAAATTTSSAAAATRKERQFRMAAHEVPSGPNPESNK